MKFGIERLHEVDALKAKGIGINQIARMLKISESTAHRAVHRKGPYAADKPADLRYGKRPHHSPPIIPDSVIPTLIKLREQGRSLRVIGEALHVSPTAVVNALKRGIV